MDDGHIVPLAVLIKAPSFLFVGQNSPFKSWADFEKQARANPGKLKVATLGFGSVDDFSHQDVWSQGGIKFVQVPFSTPERALCVDPRRPRRLRSMSRPATSRSF